MARLLSLALLAGLSFAPPARAEADDVTFRFLTPRRFAAVVGPAKATLEIVPPSGATIVSVVCFSNGAYLGSKNSAPWMFDWDAGDGTQEYKLDAIATFSDGTQAKSSVTSGRSVASNSKIATPVKIHAIARGANGAYVADLVKDDIRLYVNGRQQGLDRLSAEAGPLRVAIVLDTSASMTGEKLKSAIEAAVAFLGALRPKDEAVVVGFSDGVSVLEGPTADRRKLETAIRRLAARGGSSLYDAIHAASDQLAAFGGRRVLLLLTDGRDEAAEGRVAGSVHTLEQARDRAIRNDVMVFVIAVSNYLSHDARLLNDGASGRILEWDIGQSQSVAKILTSLAATTGGSIVFAPRARDLRSSFARIADDLNHQYVLAYVPGNETHDDSWRELKIVVNRAGVTLTSRTGYFGPEQAAGRK